MRIRSTTGGSNWHWTHRVRCNRITDGKHDVVDWVLLMTRFPSPRDCCQGKMNRCLSHLIGTGRSRELDVFSQARNQSSAVVRSLPLTLSNCEPIICFIINDAMLIWTIGYRSRRRSRGRYTSSSDAHLKSRVTHDRRVRATLTFCFSFVRHLSFLRHFFFSSSLTHSRSLHWVTKNIPTAADSSRNVKSFPLSFG